MRSSLRKICELITRMDYRDKRIKQKTVTSPCTTDAKVQCRRSVFRCTMALSNAVSLSFMALPCPVPLSQNWNNHYYTTFVSNKFMQELAIGWTVAGQIGFCSVVVRLTRTMLFVKCNWATASQQLDQLQVFLVQLSNGIWLQMCPLPPNASTRYIYWFKLD